MVRSSRIVETSAGPGGSYARLAELGYQPGHFTEYPRARLPLLEEIDDLELPIGTPVLEIIRHTYTETNQCVNVKRMILPHIVWITHSGHESAANRLASAKLGLSQSNRNYTIGVALMPYVEGSRCGVYTARATGHALSTAYVDELLWAVAPDAAPSAESLIRPGCPPTTGGGRCRLKIPMYTESLRGLADLLLRNGHRAFPSSLRRRQVWLDQLCRFQRDRTCVDLALRFERHINTRR